MKTPKLVCGLECHQQLDTGKLFSRPPGKLHDDEPDKIICRRLHPVAGELGEVDAAALEAYNKNLEYRYECYFDTVGLVELDDEPPQPVNQAALETVLQIALMTDSVIVDSSFVMRKIVIDGSNTSGFQRTMLVAVNGALQVNGKKIGIQSLALEEDAARPMQKTDEFVVYRLDRLGIPLIELATGPDISSPEEAKAVALEIGNLFRRTGAAKRGLGSIRQDLNISIEGGSRVEIKGCQELELIDEYVRREMLRQERLLEIKAELSKKPFEPADFSPIVCDVSEIFSKTECKFLKGKKIFGARLRFFRGFLGRELQPNRRLGTEIANYVKTKTGLKGILHSDELPGYGVSEQEVERSRHALSCMDSDGFILVSSEKPKAVLALEAAFSRARAATKGVPEETRQALEDANTEYLRPLPGASRMYPETDLAAIPISSGFLKNLKTRLPLSVSERLKLYQESGLSLQLAEKMKLDNWAPFFEGLLAEKINPTFAATVLLETLVELKREGVPIENLTSDRLNAFFRLEKNGQFLRENSKAVLSAAAKDSSKPMEVLVASQKTTGVSASELQAACAKLVEQNLAMVRERKMGAVGPLMGDLMKQFRGAVAGEVLSAALRKEIEKRL